MTERIAPGLILDVQPGECLERFFMGRIVGKRAPVKALCPIDLSRFERRRRPVGVKLGAAQPEPLALRERRTGLLEATGGAQGDGLIVAGERTRGVGGNRRREGGHRFLDPADILECHRPGGEQARMTGKTLQPLVGGRDSDLRLTGIGRGDGAIEMGVGNIGLKRRQPGPLRQRLLVPPRGAEHVGQRADDFGRLALDGDDPAQRLDGGIDLPCRLRHQCIEAKRLAVIADRGPQRGDRLPRLRGPPRLVNHLDPLEAAEKLRLVDHRWRAASLLNQLLRRSTRKPGLDSIAPK